MIVYTHLNCFDAIRAGHTDRVLGPDEMLVVFPDDPPEPVEDDDSE